MEVNMDVEMEVDEPEPTLLQVPPPPPPMKDSTGVRQAYFTTFVYLSIYPHCTYTFVGIFLGACVKIKIWLWNETLKRRMGEELYNMWLSANAL